MILVQDKCNTLRICSCLVLILIVFLISHWLPVKTVKNMTMSLQPVVTVMRYFYTYTGRTFDVAMGKISGDKVKAWWYSPRDGKAELIGELDNSGTHSFDPPGEKAEGNDWVLVLDDASKDFSIPGQLK